MSWIGRLEQRLIIETGDGQRYTPKWNNPTTTQEFNYTAFDFPNVDGTFVDRARTRSPIRLLEIYFDGDDHVEDAERFRVSAADPRQWRILHPYWDELRVQPLRLFMDQRAYNLTKFTIRVMETINAGLPTREPSFSEEIAARKLTLNEAIANDYTNQINNIQPTEINTIEDSIDDFDSITGAVIEVEEDQVTFRNRVIAAQNAVTNVVNDANNAIRRIQEVIDFPGQIVGNVRARIEAVIENYNRLRGRLDNISGASRNDKLYLANAGATDISAVAVVATNNIDYNTRDEVADAIDLIIDLFDQFVIDMDAAQSDNQTELESFNVNTQVLSLTQDLVNFTIANLFEIALGIQQEHVIIVGFDTNPILMSHRVYGTDINDENLNRFIETNQIGLNEILRIPKGRELVYFIGG